MQVTITAKIQVIVSPKQWKLLDETVETYRHVVCTTR